MLTRRVGPGWVGSGSDKWLGSARDGSGPVESSWVGSGPVESSWVGSGRVGSGRVGSGWFGPGRIGSGEGRGDEGRVPIFARFNVSCGS